MVRLDLSLYDRAAEIECNFQPRVQALKKCCRAERSVMGGDFIICFEDPLGTKSGRISLLCLGLDQAAPGRHSEGGCRAKVGLMGDDGSLLAVFGGGVRQSPCGTGTGPEGEAD